MYIYRIGVHSVLSSGSPHCTARTFYHSGLTNMYICTCTYAMDKKKMLPLHRKLPRNRCNISMQLCMYGAKVFDIMNTKTQRILIYLDSPV